MWHHTRQRRIQTVALLAERCRREHHFARNDAVVQNLLIVIDVVDERVQGVDALLQAALDVIPFVGGDDARNQVEGEDALGPGGFAIDVESDAHLQQQALRRVLIAQQVAFGQRFDGFEQERGVRPRSAAASNISS